jgi:hypothetical protein
MVINMYDTWSKIKKPENLDAKIWRYVDFAKFLSLIMSESLFFCRIDKLDDPFEGYYTYQDLYIQRERYKNAFLEQGFDGDIDKFLVVSLYVVDLYRWFTHLYLCQIAN